MIKLKEITKYYYSDSNVTLALKNINLEFKKGEFVAITGKSGSGKSTLINLISGMDSYEEGEMYFRGMETSYYDDGDWELYRKNNISFVYQSYNLIESYTALQNVEAVMMICETDENRRTKRERKERAMEMLRKVGLEKQAHNRASHMSSGQKQRLGIARALAKETDVIVADEPTGNLDIENGQAVMAILHELAKENKLVLVVTHNYEQAEPYVTRKIRLFDGEVVEDMRLDDSLYADNDFQSDYKEEQGEEPEAVKTFKTAREFVHINRFAQPYRSMFMFIFMLASAMATVIFAGYFVSNLDDTKTRYVSDAIFANVSDTRLLVKRPDGESMTEEDYKKIEEIPKIEQVQAYDNASDCYYFAEENEDYKKIYEVGAIERKIRIQKLKYEHFVKTAESLDEEALKAGRLPEGIHEIAVYADSDSVLGETKEVYVSDREWKEQYYIGAEFTIVGILKDESEQIYFSAEFAKSIDKTQPFTDLNYAYTIEEKSVYDDENTDDIVVQRNRGGRSALAIGDDLTGNQVRLSKDVINEMYPDGQTYKNHTTYRYILEEGSLTHICDDGTEETYEIVYVKDGNLCSGSVLEVSSELYYKITGEPDVTQAVVFLENYAYTEQVLNELYEEGYDAISALKVSALEYDPQLTSGRLILLAVSVAVILVIFVLDIFVIYLLMKLKRGDLLIMKSLGMKQKMAGQMNYYELCTLILAADIVAIIAGIICREAKVPLISDIMIYLRWNHYLMVIIINGLMAAVTAKVYNRYLGKQFRLTALRNE